MMNNITKISTLIKKRSCYLIIRRSWFGIIVVSGNLNNGLIINISIKPKIMKISWWDFGRIVSQKKSCNKGRQEIGLISDSKEEIQLLISEELEYLALRIFWPLPMKTADTENTDPNFSMIVLHLNTGISFQLQVLILLRNCCKILQKVNLIYIFLNISTHFWKIKHEENSISLQKCQN